MHSCIMNSRDVVVVLNMRMEITCYRMCVTVYRPVCLQSVFNLLVACFLLPAPPARQHKLNGLVIGFTDSMALIAHVSHMSLIACH
jgi:hypothetical protein